MSDIIVTSPSITYLVSDHVDRVVELRLALFMSITAADWIAGSKLVGALPAGSRSLLIAVDVTTPFNGGAQCTVGDAAAAARLLTIDESNLTLTETFQTFRGVAFAALTNIRVYFASGTPTQGVGSIIIYYQ